MWQLRNVWMAAAAATALVVRADEYFEGDGTAYTLNPPGAGNCNFMHYPPDATDNYAALNTPQWDELKNCGRCAEVSCADPSCTSKTSQIVHVMDRCPECKLGDLDLSPSVFKTITGTTPSRLRIRWKFVDCPVTGNVKYCLKGGSNNFWTAIQPANMACGVSSMKINNQATTMVTSAYYYLFDGKSATQTDLSSVKVSITSVNGEVIEDTVSLTAGSCTEGKHQFSKGGGGSSGATNRQVTPTSPPSASSSPSPTETPKPTTTSAAPSSTPSSTPSPKPAPSTSSHSEDSVSMEASDIKHTVRPATQNSSGSAGTVHAASTTSSSSGSSPQTTTSNNSDTPSGSTANSASPKPSPVASATPKPAEDNVQTISTKESGGNATSVTILALGAAAAVGVAVLVAVVIVTKRKKLQDKRADDRLERSVVTRSFDNMATPSNPRADIAIL